MITVKSREEAWREADRLFPTDYAKDTWFSKNAGYPIYLSTAEGNGSWISDLNSSLELNLLDDDNAVKTIRINIVQEPEIEVEERWESEEIREMCIAKDWYSRGTIKAYSDMLSMVEHSDPTPANIYKAAKDIYEHSEKDGVTVEAIMFEIANEVVKRFYTVRG